MGLKKKKVFVVDDDESVRRAFKVMLMTFDFEVEIFSSAKGFFDAVSHDEPGCLLLDIHMPEMDGWAAQKKIKDSGSNRPVIFISAEKPDISNERALSTGAVAFLQKPVDGQKLADLINSAAEVAYGGGK